MLLRFGVRNHLSICERQELSFAASSLKDPQEGLLACEAVPRGAVVPAIVLYGANASGKTNLVDALAAMQKMILWSHTRGEPGKGVPRQAFKLDPKYLKAPSQFDIDFTINDVRYHYGFEATDEAFTAEWLYVFPRAYRRKLFERNGDEIDFGRWLRGANNNIARLTRPNSLFLSAAAQNDHEQLSSVYKFFQSMKFTGNIFIRGVEASSRYMREGIDDRVINFLESINTGVVGYRKKETQISEEAQTIGRELRTVLEKLSGDSIEFGSDDEDKFVAIELAHKARGGEQVYFDLDLESAGTRRLLIILGQAYQALDEGLPLVVDEFDASLHTHACEVILKLFGTSQTNKNGAQLIATTHDTNLMKSSVLRRDQLWFAEKSSEGATGIYPLTDIQTRKGDNLELGYLQGRYGALPNEDLSSLFRELS